MQVLSVAAWLTVGAVVEFIADGPATHGLDGQMLTAIPTARTSWNSGSPVYGTRLFSTVQPMFLAWLLTESSTDRPSFFESMWEAGAGAKAIARKGRIKSIRISRKV